MHVYVLLWLRDIDRTLKQSAQRNLRSHICFEPKLFSVDVFAGFSLTLRGCLTLNPRKSKPGFSSITLSVWVIRVLLCLSSKPMPFSHSAKMSWHSFTTD